MGQQVYFEDVSEGTEIPKLAKNCSTQQLVMWAAASGDFYQIHYDERFAKNNQLQDIIVHGALKCAFLGQFLHDWAGEQGKIKNYSVSYRGMDYTAQEILCKGTVTKKYEDGGDHIVELDIWTETGAGEDNGRPKNEVGIKTTPGAAKVILPVRG
jgi:acyl dehydratase